MTRPFYPHAIKLVIFDLDGTLIDSRLDLVHSVNAMLRHFKHPELPDEIVASYVGDGAPMLVRRALGDPNDEGFFKEALEFFLGYYREHKLDNTVVYEGIPQALETIRAGDRDRDARCDPSHAKPRFSAVIVTWAAPSSSGRLAANGCGVAALSSFPRVDETASL
jgi:beta-phosphoglucomutase-like phosphatase (HAD superfamily)